MFPAMLAHSAVTRSVDTAYFRVRLLLMFQTFDATTQPDTCGPRLAAVRQLMLRARLSALLVPRADAHQGEYVTPGAERLRWLTSFTGSAGLAIVTAKRTCLLVDGRYTTQAQGQTDIRHVEVVQIASTFEVEAQRWLSSNLTKGDTIGFDPWLHTIEQIETLTMSISRAELVLKAKAANLIDRAWGAERPSAPAAEIEVHGEIFSGRSASDKITSIQSELKAAGHSALVVTLPDNIAWLFNIRGKDVPHTPVALAFAIVHAKGKPELFISAARPNDLARFQLNSIAKLRAPEELPHTARSTQRGLLVSQDRWTHFPAHTARTGSHHRGKSQKKRHGTCGSTSRPCA
jgi:Xaa-Pro aminopeptidase